MTESIVDISRDFFKEIVLPIFEREFPDAAAQTAFGLFGYGSDVLRMDDEFSRDHNWGIRINALMPDAMFSARSGEILQRVSTEIPSVWRGHELQRGFANTFGLELGSLEGHLLRTIGIARPPQNNLEWLAIPEEDITHIVGGEVWHDPLGKFSAVRETLNAYYPEPVRLRRIAHWARYYSGMGAYALKRAILRDNDYYANITFTRAIRLGVQMSFLLDKQYFPYDKWTFAFFKKLPRMSKLLEPLVSEAVKLETPWTRKLEILNEMSDVFDAVMVQDGIVPPHPKLRGSESSGYRLMEHAYAEILKQLPKELALAVPIWDQIYFEGWHSGYVADLDMQVWDGLLNLSAEEQL